MLTFRGQDFVNEHFLHVLTNAHNVLKSVYKTFHRVFFSFDYSGFLLTARRLRKLKWLPFFPAPAGKRQESSCTAVPASLVISSLAETFTA